MNLSDVIRLRRSVRKFKPDPVPPAMIARLLEAAVCAPSASNRQPWRFMVVVDPDLQRRLGAGVQTALEAAARDLVLLNAADFLAYGRHFLHFVEAPALIVALCRSGPVMANLFRENTPTRERLKTLEEGGAVMSVAMAVQNMLLAATDQDLGTCVMTGPLIAEESFNKLLAVPEGWKIACLVCVGFAAETPEPISKKTAEQVTARRTVRP